MPFRIPGKNRARIKDHLIIDPEIFRAVFHNQLYFQVIINLLIQTMHPEKIGPEIAIPFEEGCGLGLQAISRDLKTSEAKNPRRA